MEVGASLKLNATPKNSRCLWVVYLNGWEIIYKGRRAEMNCLIWQHSRDLQRSCFLSGGAASGSSGFCGDALAKTLGMQPSNYMEISVPQGYSVYFKAGTEKKKWILKSSTFSLGFWKFSACWVVGKTKSTSPGLGKIVPSHGKTKALKAQLCRVPISHCWCQADALLCAKSPCSGVLGVHPFQQEMLGHFSASDTKGQSTRHLPAPRKAGLLLPLALKLSWSWEMGLDPFLAWGRERERENQQFVQACHVSQKITENLLPPGLWHISLHSVVWP